MKSLKITILGLLFFSGFISNANETVLDTAKADEDYTVPCENVFSVCDNAHPADYELFMLCMSRNGC